MQSFSVFTRLNTCVMKVCVWAAGAALVFGLDVTALSPLFIDFPGLDFFSMVFLAGVVLCS